MTEKKKNKKWIRFRHRAVRNLLYVFFAPFCRLKYGIKIERFKEQKKIPYTILLNHQTPFDQFFVGLSFHGPIYYLATEDLFSNGFISRLITYLVAPIPIKKQTTDVRAVITCMRVSKEGGTVCIAPEGNRTYSGRTEYMNPAIVPLVRKLGNPLLLYRIEGGYGVQPRWSDVVRKGKMRGYVSRVITPEEYALLSDEELLSLIKEGLYVNEAIADGEYKHKRRAEYLERAIYVCPYCGLSEFESRFDIIECKKCRRRVRYGLKKELSGVGFDFPYSFVADWYDAQASFINQLHPEEYGSGAIYSDIVDIYEVFPYKNKKCLSRSISLELCGEGIRIGKGENAEYFEYGKISSMAVLGRNKLNVYHGGRIYQFKGGKRFNALKYVHIYNRYKNIVKGDVYGEFLGL